MAEEHVGARKDGMGELMPWTKLFTAFKVALDPKKLLLAAAGILAMSFGWWLLSWMFFSFSTEPPRWDPQSSQSWDDVKLARARWNLLYSLAGSPERLKNKDDAKADELDLASSPKEFLEIKKEKERLTGIITSKRPTKASLRPSDDTFNGVYILRLEDSNEPSATLRVVNKEDNKTLKGLVIDGKLTITPKDVTPEPADNKVTIKVAEKAIAFVNAGGPGELKRLVNELEGVPSTRDIETLPGKDPVSPEVRRKALLLADPLRPRYRPYGKLSTLPWFEYRGPNPYMLVSGRLHSESAEGATRNVPWQRGEFFTWLTNDQAPVLLEPLMKFLTPITALFNPGAGGWWNRLYLFLAIFWSLAVWGLFGGAIARIAAVQIARPNEKVGLVEAVRFSRSRYKSYLLAPLLPLIFMVGLTFLLVLFGWFEAFTFGFGDIVGPLIFWPLILLVGLIMAVVLVGLVGWPLMYPTIGAEGSDSFDAISRSYSYVYQAPWQYVWYGFLALLYGAVLIFFVGFMGSLTVYLSKWGVSQAPVIASREPTYLFIYSPTSFDWRDLLLSGHPNAMTQEEVRPDGSVDRVLGLSDDYMKDVSIFNKAGAVLMSFWLYLLFLLVVGFGYSYFWTASTIIYLLMRKKVDDTEMDEVHLEEEEMEEPYPKPAPTPAAPSQPPAPAGGAVMVDAPTLRPQSSPAPAPPAREPVVAEPVPETKDGESKPAGEAGQGGPSS